MNLSDIIVSDPRQTITVPAASAVSSGDLVTLLESGQVAKTSTTLGIPNENVTTAGPSAIRAVADVESTNSNYGAQAEQHKTMCELGDGNIAMVYTGNGTTLTTGINLRIRTILGADVIPKTVLTEDVSIYGCRVLKISGTKFIVAWCSSATLKFMIINNDGSTSVAATTIATLSNNDNYYWNLALLSSGEFVFVYNKQTSNNVCFSRYNSSGALQGTETTIEAGAVGQYFTVLGCSNGDFVVSYYRSASTAAHKSARYSASGVQVGTLVTLGTNTPPTTGDYNNGIIELSNGNVVITKLGVSDYPDLEMFNSSHVSQKTIDLETDVVASEVPQLVVNSGGFAVFYRTASPYKVAIKTFNNSGAGILGPVLFGTGGGAATTAIGAGVQAFVLGSSGYAVVKAMAESNGPTCSLRLMVIDSVGTLVGSEVVLVSPASGYLYGLSSILTSGGTIALMYKNNYLKDAYYHVQRRSVLGVANTTVTAGQSVEVKTKGTYTINQTFGMGGSFNNQATVVPGSKGIVSGSTAILTGVSA